MVFTHELVVSEIESVIIDHNEWSLFKCDLV